MPRYTDHYGFPYPIMSSEPVSATAWQNLSNAIDAQMSIINALGTQVKFPNVITAVRSANQAISLNTLTDVTFTSAEFQNPAGMWTSGSTITLPEVGIFYVSANARVTSTTVTFNRLQVATTGTDLSSAGPPNAVNHSATATAGEWNTNLTCLIPATSANWTIKIQVLMNGTGSPNITNAALSVVRLSLL